MVARISACQPGQVVRGDAWMHCCCWSEAAPNEATTLRATFLHSHSEECLTGTRSSRAVAQHSMTQRSTGCPHRGDAVHKLGAEDDIGVVEHALLERHHDELQGGGNRARHGTHEAACNGMQACKRARRLRGRGRVRRTRASARVAGLHRAPPLVLLMQVGGPVNCALGHPRRPFPPSPAPDFAGSAA